MPSERSTPAVSLWALSALLAAMVVFFVLGSGSELSLTSVGHSGRWILLALVWCVAASIFVVAARRNRTDPVPLWAIAALALPILGVVSALWSVAPTTTIARSLSLGILATASLFLAYASVSDRRVVDHVLGGLLAGAAVAGLAGVVLVFADRTAAVQPAGEAVALRYRGLGENPNTFSMLAAVALPLAVWAMLKASRGLVRAAAGVSGAVFLGSISFSASRGAFLAALIAMSVFAFARPRGRVLVELSAVAGIFAISFVLALIPQPTGRAPVAGAPVPGQGASPPGAGPGSENGSGPPLPASIAGYNPSRLQDEEGRPVTGGGKDISHPLLGSSGRATAWVGAVKQANQRPATGYGFGTEDRVFVDRFYFFQGDRPENSWVGMYLQLGAAGVLILLAFWVSLFPAVWSAVRRPRDDAGAALVAACTAGLLLTIPQSYFYSVGNVATATVWFLAALLAFSVVRSNSGGARAEAS